MTQRNMAYHNWWRCVIWRNDATWLHVTNVTCTDVTWRDVLTSHGVVLKENWTPNKIKFVLFERTLRITKFSFSFWFPCFVFEIFQFLWFANYTYDVVYVMCISENCTSIAYKLRHMLFKLRYLHIKETEISQKRSKGIKNWKITYSVILKSVLSNKTILILGFSSPWIDWYQSSGSAINSVAISRSLGWKTGTKLSRKYTIGLK